MQYSVLETEPDFIGNWAKLQKNSEERGWGQGGREKQRENREKTEKQKEKGETKIER